VLGRLALAGLVRERPFSADAWPTSSLRSRGLLELYPPRLRSRQRGQVHLSFEASADRVTMVVWRRQRGGGFHEDDVDCPECSAVRPSSSPRAAWASRSSARVDEFVSITRIARRHDPHPHQALPTPERRRGSGGDPPETRFPNARRPAGAGRRPCADSDALRAYAALLATYELANVTGARGSPGGRRRARGDRPRPARGRRAAERRDERRAGPGPTSAAAAPARIPLAWRCPASGSPSSRPSPRSASFCGRPWPASGCKNESTWLARAAKSWPRSAAGTRALRVVLAKAVGTAGRGRRAAGPLLGPDGLLVAARRRRRHSARRRGEAAGVACGLARRGRTGRLDSLTPCRARWPSCSR